MRTAYAVLIFLRDLLFQRSVGGGGEIGVDEAVDIAVHDILDVAGLKARAGVLHQGVGHEHIGADLTAPLDLYLHALDVGDLLRVLLGLHFRQAGAEHLHAVVPVPELAALRLAGHHHPVGIWMSHTAEEVLLMCWPPAPLERKTCISTSSGRISISLSSSISGMTSRAEKLAGAQMEKIRRAEDAKIQKLTASLEKAQTSPTGKLTLPEGVVLRVQDLCMYFGGVHAVDRQKSSGRQPNPYSALYTLQRKERQIPSPGFHL